MYDTQYFQKRSKIVKPLQAIVLSFVLAFGTICPQALAEESVLLLTQQSQESFKDCDRDEQQARQAIAATPSEPQPYLDLANALVCLDRFEDAIAAYQTAIERYRQANRTDPFADSGIIYAYFGLAKTLVEQDRLEEAFSAYRQAIELDPIYGHLVNLLPVRDFSPLGEPITDAFRGDGYYAAVRAEESSDASAYYELGQALEGKNRWADATAAYRKAIEQSPNFAHAHNALGRALYRQNRVDDAIAAYDQALQLNPELVWAYYNLGQALAKQNRIDDAIAALRKVIAFHPGLDNLPGIKDQILYSTLGEMLAEQGNREAALDAYNRAIAIQPENGYTYLYLGRVLLDSNRLEEAVVALRKAASTISAQEERVQAYLSLGEALMNQRKLEDARAAIDEASAILRNWAESQRDPRYLEP